MLRKKCCNILPLASTQCCVTTSHATGLVITVDFNRIKLIKLCRYFSLGKVVKAPTRGRNTLILTDMSDLYDDVEHLAPLGLSDVY